MEDHYKEVDFHKYCPTCAYADSMEHDVPCYKCLSEPVNLNSHRPVYWKEGEK